MARHLVLAALAFAAVSAAVAEEKPGWFGPGTVHNKLTVTWGLIPDPFGKFNFFDLPRDSETAGMKGWQLVSTMYDGDIMTFCHNNDHTVCLHFDRSGSIAGIQMAVKADEMKSFNVPIDLENTPEWYHYNWAPFGDVYANNVFFQSIEQIKAGGRGKITDDDLTAPNGLYIMQNGGRNWLHVSTQQKDAESAGFKEQSCFIGMGKHYFLDLTKDSKCEKSRPYFMLYGPKTQELNGFGFTMYGKPKKVSRGWFESPPAIAAKMIAPNSPDCLSDYINTYGMFTMHVFFISRPYLTWC